MENSIKIKAKNKEEALVKAKKKLSIDSDSVRFDVSLLEKAGSFLGLGKKENTYLIKYHEKTITSSDEEFIDNFDEINVDGSYNIKINEEGVFLKINSPEGKGKAVSYEEIKNGLDEKGIVEVDLEKIEKMLAKNVSGWVKIAPRKPELDKDAEITLDVSKDKMEAFITFEPAQGGNTPSLEELRNKLKDEGLVYGIKENILKEILENNKLVKHKLIAEGKEPLPGEDGKLIYHFTSEEKSAGKMREDGSVDFYDRQVINNISKGDTLVTLEKHKPGKPGINVKGEEVPPPEPKKVKLPSGKNVEKKDEKTLVASRDGHVVKKDNKVEVLPIYNVKGDLDLSIGKIDFVGNVYVAGNVLDGLEIKADGDIEIRGNVEGANLYSEGSVVIHKGFIGKDKAIIKAKGDVNVKFVENGTIESGGSVFIRDAIMHSHARVGGDIRVKGKKGLLVGGKVQAAGEIEANIIGSSLGTETILEAGVNPESRQKISELGEKIEEMEVNLQKAKKAVKILSEIKEKNGKLPPDKAQMYTKVLKTSEKLENEIENYKYKYRELEKGIKNAKKGCVRVNKTIYSGTKILIGETKRIITDKLGRTAFVQEAGEVIQINM